MKEKKPDSGMTVAEAGRLGGNKVVRQYGPEHMREIGRKGGQASPTKFVAGEKRTSEIASAGGKASGGSFANDPSRAAEAGRKGGKTRAANRKAAKAASKT